MIRVAIIADSSVVRAALTSMIGAEEDLQIVATIGDSDAPDDGGSARARLLANETDVAVWVPQRASFREGLLSADEGDLDAPPHGAATMVLLERMDEELAREAYGAGARAVLVIDASANELLAALRAAAEGLVVMHPALSTELLGDQRGLRAAASPLSQLPASLTPREREVLTLLAQGLPNKAIAPRLGITEHTVKTHVAAVYEKLNAGNRAEAVVAAARLGLIML